MDLKALSHYACVSERTLRDWIRSAVDPLPASQRGGKLYVSRRAFDQWMDRHAVADSAALVKKLVDEVVGSIQS